MVTALRTPLLPQVMRQCCATGRCAGRRVREEQASMMMHGQRNGARQVVWLRWLSSVTGWFTPFAKMGPVQLKLSRSLQIRHANLTFTFTVWPRGWVKAVLRGRWQGRVPLQAPGVWCWPGEQRQRVWERDKCEAVSSRSLCIVGASLLEIRRRDYYSFYQIGPKDPTLVQGTNTV